MLANDMKEIFAMLREERLNTARRCMNIVQGTIDGYAGPTACAEKAIDQIRLEFELDYRGKN